MTQKPSALISTEALERDLSNPKLRILDASWHMPSEKRDAYAEYQMAHIPGATFFDIDTICDLNSPYPHMLPTSEAFATTVSQLGIGNDSDVVVYDSLGLFSAARVWWMFRVFGHTKVRVLDGGLPKWKKEHHRLESGDVKHLPAVFQVTFKPELLRTKEQIQVNIMTHHELVLDARSPGRFGGEEPEPRPGLRSGHIEGSKNLFFKDILVAGKIKTPEELHVLLEEKDINPSQPIAVTCGSGVTACILALAFHELGNDTVAVYDGAWAEWGSQL